MRAFSVCLVFGLVLLIVWTSETQPNAHAVPERCCFDFVDFKIPSNKIVSAVRTSSHCPIVGAVITTPKTEFCVKPNEAWVKTALEKQLQK